MTSASHVGRYATSIDPQFRGRERPSALRAPPSHVWWRAHDPRKAMSTSDFGETRSPGDPRGLVPWRDVATEAPRDSGGGRTAASAGRPSQTCVAPGAEGAPAGLSCPLTSRPASRCRALEGLDVGHSTKCRRRCRVVTEPIGRSVGRVCTDRREPCPSGPAP